VFILTGGYKDQGVQTQVEVCNRHTQTILQGKHHIVLEMKKEISKEE
jgi:hypothetical protein